MNSQSVKNLIQQSATVKQLLLSHRLKVIRLLNHENNKKPITSLIYSVFN